MNKTLLLLPLLLFFTGCASKQTASKEEVAKLYVDAVQENDFQGYRSLWEQGQRTNLNPGVFSALEGTTMQLVTTDPVITVTYKLPDSFNEEPATGAVHLDDDGWIVFDPVTLAHPAVTAQAMIAMLQSPSIAQRGGAASTLKQYGVPLNGYIAAASPTTNAPAIAKINEWWDENKEDFDGGTGIKPAKVDLELGAKLAKRVLKSYEQGPIDKAKNAAKDAVEGASKAVGDATDAVKEATSNVLGTAANKLNAAKDALDDDDEPVEADEPTAE